ncbi:hypothetical protein LVD15_26410 [Fulvivirga maritima]|uniref:hypothetical protein n=1 Tax=Fulvivirga maritima TaxID=2904247 RepID=UPI001F331A82|nr:hypothetical protein [Fulvivirga maritima]UII26785.1 hypothetical protein LVD15_26410 [Fulvivirga maritima]
MKNPYLLYFLVVFVFFVTSCSNDDSGTPNPEEVQIELLKGSWRATQVTLNETDQDGWDDFEIEFTEETYITTNTQTQIWPESGSWHFVEGSLNQMERGDGIVIDFQVTGSALTMTFMFSSTHSSGKLNGLDGVYAFQFQKQ